MPRVSITTIYDHYRIMPALQEHQLRVTAVAFLIVQSCNITSIDESAVITACFLHDMGNIIKFDLHHFPEFVQPEGVEYWQSVKDQFVQKYGPNEHQASIAIAKELGVSPKVLQYIESVGFRQSVHNAASSDLSQQICDYADMRVGPHGIMSLDERFQDLRLRYQQKYAGSSHTTDRHEFEQALRSIESTIQSRCAITLSVITDQAVSGTIDTLRNWTLDVPTTWHVTDKLGN